MLRIHLMPFFSQMIVLGSLLGGCPVLADAQNPLTENIKLDLFCTSDDRVDGFAHVVGVEFEYQPQKERCEGAIGHQSYGAYSHRNLEFDCSKPLVVGENIEKGLVLWSFQTKDQPSDPSRLVSFSFLYNHRDRQGTGYVRQKNGTHFKFFCRPN